MGTQRAQDLLAQAGSISEQKGSVEAFCLAIDAAVDMLFPFFFMIQNFDTTTSRVEFLGNIDFRLQVDINCNFIVRYAECACVGIFEIVITHT